MARKIDLETATHRQGSGYPEPFRNKSPTRIKTLLGKAGGLTDFGINLVRLPPGEWSSQRHWHEREEEFVYILSGELTLITNDGEAILRAGDCVAFPKNVADGHHMINRSGAEATYLEVGTHHADEVAHYPDIDMMLSGGAYRRRSGEPY
jgi:uncharacterized cupin superfamily protein